MLGENDGGAHQGSKLGGRGRGTDGHAWGGQRTEYCTVQKIQYKEIGYKTLGLYINYIYLRCLYLDSSTYSGSAIDV